ncbi:MAG: sigma-70 family RNA polymerase sigma factor [Candidatus Pseudobacter hemicellulosilyticus]|uniref:Sigma-70 family RNA polymerase sigma factor n=1 Tax=Candidatus Pseudobacter hemicellulosilyticus TaxID=3121375 RepID=A0AAJ6BJK3_9BACT|nr:MAG: sigma-70 family RNA polymerase sigma factor [Pseudobacter sp.]
MTRSTWHNEEVLAAGIRAGDERAFAWFYKLHFASFLYFTNMLLRQLPESEHIVLLNMQKLWERRTHFDTISNMRSFMYTACRNKAYDFLRTGGGPARRQEVLMPDLDSLAAESLDPGAETAMIRTELFREMHQEIGQLSDRQREVLTLLIAGRSHKEIAAALGLTEPVVRNHKMKAIARLRELLSLKKLISLLLFFCLG